MHKVQMNSSSFDPESVKKRISHFDEFDNGHVLFSYSKMSVADSEEKAKQASIKHPDDVYYVSYDDLMNSCSDTYWFQGVAYDNKGAWKALREYRKAQAAGLNSGRRPLNSSEEQVKISGIVTIYSDFVDFKRSVSEHLLQTAVGDRAKLKFKWVGDNKVEVKAICSVADEGKVKILLENSDVTKTVAWSSSANSNRKVRDKVMRKVQMNSSASCDDYVKLSTATLKRKLKTATPEEKKCIQAELNARGVYSKRSVNSAETSSDSYVDVDGVIGSRGDVWTVAELADYWNREQVNDPILSEYATYEDWLDDTLAAMRPLDSSRKVNSSRKEGNNSMRKVIFRGKLNSSRRKLNSSADEGFEKYFDRMTDKELADYYDIPVTDITDTNDDIEACGYGKVVGHYIPKDKYAEVLVDGDWDTLDILEDGTVGFSLGEGGGEAVRFYGVDIDSIKEAVEDAGLDSSRKRMNSSRRKRLNSSKKSEILEFTGWSHDDLADAFEQWIYDGGGEYEEDEQFDRFADAVAESVERGDTEDYFGIPLKASRRKRLNSSEDDITADDDIQDTGIDGGDTATETAELLDNALIVQNPETKEVSLFVATEDDEVLPESVDVIAEVTPVVEGAVLNSSRRLKRFAAAKLNSSKGCLNSEAEDVCPGCGKPYDECECEPGTVAYDEIQLPDDTVVEVENILVVQDDEGELGLFMPEDSEEAVPEGYEVVATATPAAEADVLDSSRRMKKSNAKKLNSSAKRKNR